MGSRILEYIIRAKDATAAAIRAAKDRVISLSRESARAKVEIKGEDKTAQAVESAKRRVKEAAAEIQESVKATSGKIAQDGAGAFGKLENSAGKAATNILSQMAGIPGPVGNVLSQIGSMASASFGGIAAAVTAAIAIAKKVIDSMVDKWRQGVQIMADNWRLQGQRIEETSAKIAKSFEKADAALQRMQGNRAAMQGVQADNSAAERALAREREMQKAIEEGADSKRVESIRKAWEQEDKLLALERQEAEVIQQINDARERNTERINRRGEMQEQIASAEAALRNANDAIFQRVQDMRNKGTWQEVKEWYAGDPGKELEAAASDKAKSALRALIAAYDRKEQDQIDYGQDDALAKRLEAQLQGLDAEKKTVALAQKNADAYKAIAEWEEYDAKLQEYLANEQEQAAQEELRRQEQLARERERIERELERERERLAEQAYRKEVRLAQDAANESARAQSEAQSRLSAADARVAQAWTWYRDNDAMQAHIDDVLAQREAEKRFEKDFAKLENKFRGRGDWRTVDIGKLSAAEEATRQVALAKEEQRAAQESLKQIEANTRDLAAKLDELLTAKEGA